jgi:superfamily II DNA/RNA helicase
MSKTKSETPSFRELNIAEPLLRALDKIGYETPSPIQAQAIPPLLKGKAARYAEQGRADHDPDANT